MYAFADKLLEVSERNADKIADQWCKAVKANPHTPWFQAQKTEACNLFAIDFYKNFRSVYFDRSPTRNWRNTSVTTPRKISAQASPWRRPSTPSS